MTTFHQLVCPYVWIHIIAIISAARALSCSAPPISARFGYIDIRHGAGPAPGGINQNRPQGYGVEVLFGGQAIAASLDATADSMQVTTGNKLCYSKNVPIDCVPYIQSGYEATIGGMYFPDIGVNSSTTLSVPEDKRTEPTEQFRDAIEVGGTVIGSRQFTGTVGRAFTKASVGIKQTSEFFKGASDFIPSSTWGFFPGWDGLTPDTTQNGTLVLGGYDSGPVGGEFKNFPLVPKDPAVDSDCPTTVVVKGMRWFNASVDIPLPFRACINPKYNGLELPTPVYISVQFKIFYDILNLDIGTSVPTEAATIYDAEKFIKLRDLEKYQKQYDSDLTIELDGLEIKIPTHQIFKPVRKYDYTNIAGMNTPSKLLDYRVFPVAEAANNNMPIFGLPFLTAAYLFVNYSNQTFSLAPIKTTVNPTPTIVPYIDHDNCSNNRLPKWAIATIAVGSVAIALIIGTLIYVFHKLYQRRKPLPFPPEIPELPGESVKPREVGGAFTGNEIFQIMSNPVYHLSDHHAREKQETIEARAEVP